MIPPVAALSPLPFELVLDDGEPFETDWHSVAFSLLRTLIIRTMAEQGRADFFCGGHIFVYYSVEQAWAVAEEEKGRRKRQAFRGPDVFWVGGVDKTRNRQAWIAWEEGGRLPDVIIELLSPSTAQKDRTEKRDLYAQVFRTAEYFLYDPETRQLDGLRLSGRSYRSIESDENGRLRSEQLGVSLGLWHGALAGLAGTTCDWVRLFRPDGTLVPTPEERAEAAEAEADRLRALLDERR
jgi:Uma2 family endonuclease